jgi:hypothetical protein
VHTSSNVYAGAESLVKAIDCTFSLIVTTIHAATTNFAVLLLLLSILLSLTAGAGCHTGHDSRHNRVCECSL